MQEDTTNNELLNEFVDKLNIVKTEFIKLKKEQLVSIRRDVVKVELQNILNNSTNYEELQYNLKEYINTLLNLEDNNE